MSRFELSLSPQYVGSWKVVDAIRELFQNAIDQETVDPANKMFFAYDKASQVLSIGNKSSVLDKKTLLLGESTKVDDKRTIGQFGEGYKIAALVLLRLGKQLKIYNYGVSEVWEAKIIKSRRYNANILVFDVTEKRFWQSVPDNDLTIVINGITPEEYDDIVASNLHFHTLENTYLTSYGSILYDAEYKGKVFVNGLFVADVVDLQYGYDIKPAYLELDRDRRLVKDFDLQWRTSSMWNESNDTDKALSLVQRNSIDVKYIRSLGVTKPNLRMSAAASFRSEYGDNAVPVSDQSELNNVKMTYTDAKPVIVNEVLKKLIEESPTYSTAHLTEHEDMEVLAPVDILKAFYDAYGYTLSRDGQRAFSKILTISETWSNEE